MTTDKPHKCDTCRDNFAECEGRGIVWGIDRDPSARGAEADKVLECASYLPVDTPPPVQSVQNADTDPHEKDESRAGIRPFERNAERRPVDRIL